MRRRCFLPVKFFSLFALLFGALCLSSCASTKQADSHVSSEFTLADDSPAQVAETPVSVQEEKNEGLESIRLPSSSKPKSYFSKIDEAVLADVEKGSPAALTRAMAAIHKNEADYSENEKVLIYIAGQLMTILWPSQKMNWTVYETSADTPYIAALNSVKKGIYDTSTGNKDFLSTFLPTLVFLTPNITANVQAQCWQGLTDSLAFNSSSVAANYLAGLYCQKNSRSQEAENYLKKAYDESRAEDSVIMEIVLEYARVLSNNGKAALAESVMNDLPTSSKTSLQVLKQNAYIAFGKGDLAAAEENVARVLQQTPNDLEFVLFRARIFIEKNDYIHAVSLLDMYARQNDTNIDYLILRARVQLDWSKNTAAATETIERAMQLYPENLEAILIAAKISSATDGPVAGKYADELAAIVLQKSPGNKDALLYALEGLIQRENWTEAYQISSSLIKSAQTEDLVWQHVTVCLKLKKNSEAIELARKAYNSNPQSEVITQTYILASTQVLSREESLKLVDSMLPSASSKIKSYLYYRKSYLERTEDSVLADLRSSLIANPRNSESLFRLYEIYYDKKDYRKAQYYLKQVVAINPNDSSVRKLNEALTQLIQ